MKARLAIALVAGALFACERSATDDAGASAPSREVASAEPDTTPRTPSDPTLGLLVGTVSPAVERGIVVLVLDLVDELDGSCGDFTQEFNGSTFRCDGAPVGLYTAFVRGGATRWTRATVYIHAGEATDLGTLALVPLPPEAVIRGRVRDEAGTPIEGVVVDYPILWCAAYDMSWSQPWTTVTPADGTLLLNPIENPTGVEVSKDGYEHFSCEVRWGDVLDVVLHRR